MCIYIYAHAADIPVYAPLLSSIPSRSCASRFLISSVKLLYVCLAGPRSRFWDFCCFPVPVAFKANERKREGERATALSSLSQFSAKYFRALRQSFSRQLCPERNREREWAALTLLFARTRVYTLGGGKSATCALSESFVRVNCFAPARRREGGGGESSGPLKRMSIREFPWEQLRFDATGMMCLRDIGSCARRLAMVL